MARITINERYDEFGRAIKLKVVKQVQPFSSMARKMPDWWMDVGFDVQTHDGKFYYKGARIIAIDNFDPLNIEPTTDPMDIQWSLLLADGTYVVYKPEWWDIAKRLYESRLWRRNGR